MLEIVLMMPVEDRLLLKDLMDQEKLNEAIKLLSKHNACDSCGSKSDLIKWHTYFIKMNIYETATT